MPRPRDKHVEATLTSSRETVSIRSLKDLVLSQFPGNHPLREVILAERDVLTPFEFLAKMDVWFVLLNRRA